MKTLSKMLCCTVGLVLFSATIVLAEYVSGYFRSDGTYVQGYFRSNANSTVTDNYNYKGNYNPYTGEKGTNYYRSNPSSQYYNPYYKYHQQKSKYDW